MGDVTLLVENQLGVATTLDYGYDAGGQLTNNDGTTLTYDDNGNRIGGSYGVATGNLMSADASWTYQYDKEGNLKSKYTTAGGSSEHWTYAYTANNNLTRVQHYDSSNSLDLSVDYKYDAFGSLILRDNGTTITKYAVDGWNPNATGSIGNENFNHWAILNSDNTLQTRTIFGNNPSEVLGRVDQTGASNPAGSYYVLGDRLGSVREVLDSTGDVKDSVAYDGFGQIQPGELDAAYRGWYAFTGRQHDIEIDLQYNNARWYDPKMGRWIGNDPLGFDAGDSNLSRYVNNRPTMAVDASGMDAIYLWAPIASGPKIFTKNGHASVLIGPVDGKWYHYNFDAKDLRTKSDNVQRSGPFPDLFSAATDKGLDRYKKFLYFETTAEETKAMFDRAEMMRANPSLFFILPFKDSESAITQNCTRFSGDVLQAGLGKKGQAGKTMYFDNYRNPAGAFNENKSRATYVGESDDSWNRFRFMLIEKLLKDILPIPIEALPVIKYPNTGAPLFDLRPGKF